MLGTPISPLLPRAVLRNQVYLLSKIPRTELVIRVELELVLCSEVKEPGVLFRGEHFLDGGDWNQSSTVVFCTFDKVVVFTHVLLKVPPHAVDTKSMLAVFFNVVRNKCITDVAQNWRNALLGHPSSLNLQLHLPLLPHSSQGHHPYRPRWQFLVSLLFHENPRSGSNDAAFSYERGKNIKKYFCGHVTEIFRFRVFQIFYLLKVSFDDEV